MKLTQRQKEIAVWLAGLISTDGCIFFDKTSSSCRSYLCSIEKEWVEIMKERLTELGITAKIYAKDLRKDKTTKSKKRYFYQLNLSSTAMVYLMLSKVREFIMPRKFKVLLNCYGVKGLERYERQVDCYSEINQIKNKFKGIERTKKIKEIAEKYGLDFINIRDNCVYKNKTPNAIPMHWR